MEFPWKKMSLEEFAAVERSQGQRVVKVGEFYWKRIRPFMYRPLLPFREFTPESVMGPRDAVLGAYQHAVPPQVNANSYLNLLIFENTETYSMDCLKRGDRREIRSAAKHFTIRTIDDANEFKRKAYSVYLSFYGRTHYEYKSERQDRECFSRWADSMFQFPKVVVIGAYRNTELEAVSVSKLVEDTLVYSTVFGTTESLRLHVTGFVLHSMRESLAGHPEVKQIYIGMYNFQGRTGCHAFYMLRGCKLVIKPAWLQMNPLAEMFLKRCLPKQYEKLCGGVEGVQELLASSEERGSGDSEASGH